MYSNKLVCSVKSNNKILREKHENGNSYVYLPFGSEYSLALKNLAGRNAVVKIQIDGKEVAKNGFYLRAGDEREINGFIQDYVAERRFKFIQKTQEISDYRGDKLDDGMIRVTWQFEKEKPITKVVIEERRYNYRWRSGGWCYRCGCWHYDDEICPCHRPSPWKPHWTSTSGPFIGSANVTYTGSAGGGTQSCSVNNVYAVNNCNTGEARSLDANLVKSDEGITVDGSVVNQQFGSVYAEELEANVYDMILILRGYIGKAEVVRKPVYSRDKKQCSSCGRKYKGNIEFCPRDGTALK